MYHHLFSSYEYTHGYSPCHIQPNVVTSVTFTDKACSTVSLPSLTLTTTS